MSAEIGFRSQQKMKKSSNHHFFNEVLMNSGFNSLNVFCMSFIETFSPISPIYSSKNLRKYGPTGVSISTVWQSPLQSLGSRTFIEAYSLKYPRGSVFAKRSSILTLFLIPSIRFTVLSIMYLVAMNFKNSVRGEEELTKRYSNSFASFFLNILLS